MGFDERSEHRDQSPQQPQCKAHRGDCHVVNRLVNREQGAAHGVDMCEQVVMVVPQQEVTGE